MSPREAANTLVEFLRLSRIELRPNADQHEEGAKTDLARIEFLRLSTGTPARDRERGRSDRCH